MTPNEQHLAAARDFLLSQPHQRCTLIEPLAEWLATRETVAIQSATDEQLCRELNRRMFECVRGHPPDMLALWPCHRCATEASYRRGFEDARERGRGNSITGDL